MVFKGETQVLIPLLKEVSKGGNGMLIPLFNPVPKGNSGKKTFQKMISEGKPMC